jgi:hypothetical protein
LNVVLVSFVKYLFIVISCLLIASAAGGAAGLGLGWAMSLGYEKRGPNDVADAPAYVALGLMYMGAMLGAVAGFLGGVLICIMNSLKRKAVQERPPESKLFS